MNFLSAPYKKGKNKTKALLDPSVHMNAATYCSFVESMMEKDCFVSSILELWQYNKQKISKLTKEDILRKVNSVKEK